VNKRRGCGRWITVTLSVITVLACVALAVSALLYYRLQQARAQNQPPSVMITEPAEGASGLEGSYMGVSAMAFGGIPIIRAELWVDGELVETEETSIEGGVSPFYASFELLVSQGLHTAFVRAVNAAGLIGDSWPVGIGGMEKPGPNDPARLVTVAEGQTLEDIAVANDANLDTMHQLNPDLGGQQPAAGSTVVLPPPQSKTQPGPGGAPPIGPTLPPVGPPVGPAIPPAGPMVTGTTPLLPVSPGGLVGVVVDLWPTAAPAAPTNLQAEVTECQVRLSWSDNAANEQRYEVWYLWNIGQAPALIAKLNPAKGGQVWYEFPAPSSGAFVFWVEAVNAAGKQSSNKVGAMVGLSCAQTVAKELQIEALDMTVPASENQVYCYASFEGTPHVRVPAGTNDFIQVTGGNGNIGPWASGTNKLVVPIPGDGSLEVKGKCLGWSGGKLSELGTFSGQYASATWDGARRSLAGTGYEIGLSIKPLGGALDASGLTTLYSFEDPTLPVPYDVVEHKLFSPWPIDPLLRSLTWKYDNPKNATITGFQILLNGVPYNPGGGWTLIGPTGRSAEVRLPKDCGMHIAWQVRAIAGEAMSKRSALKTPENSYDLPTCPAPMYAMVKWNTITFLEDCDDLDLYWWLKVNSTGKYFGGSCDPVLPWAPPYCAYNWKHINDDCGPHSVVSLAEGMRRRFDQPEDDPYPNIVVAPLGQTLAGGGSDPIRIHIEDAFWNTMILTGGDDLVGTITEIYNFASLKEAQDKLGCGREVCVGPGTGDPYASEHYNSGASVCYTLYIFPQAEGLNCPVKQPAYIPQ
jgi:hypothetical protein